MKAIILYTTIGLLITGGTVFAADESPIKSSAISAESSPEMIAAAKVRGATTAAQDIKAGIFRILKYGKLRPITPDTRDDETGFKILVVAGCLVSEPFLAETSAYNAAMRDWHAKHLKKPASK